MREKSLFAPIRIIFALLVMGLIYNQVFRFPYYSKLSKNNAIRIIPIDSPRGTMYDRNGAALVTNRLSFDVAVIYQELKDRNKLKGLLARTLNVSRKQIEDALEKAGLKPYAPVTIVEDIDKDRAFLLEEEDLGIRGLIIETKSVRDYLYGKTGSHIFGYLSQITASELDSMKEYGYRPEDLVGRGGLEKYYDKYLSGSGGGIQIQVDNKGRHVRTLGFKEPVKGKDIFLTIDINLQAAADKLLEGRSGAIVVMEPNTGQILALSSSPSFDPNIFIKPHMSSDRMMLMRDKRNYPLLNRAISGVYPPGSIFKVVVAEGALQTGRISGRMRFNCKGNYKLGKGTFDCWKEGGHGWQDVVGGLVNSCNIFFYNTGRALGADNIEHFARQFGFGKRTGIDLPEEAKGIVPGRLWKKTNENDNWYEGDTVNYSIGQGYILVTPIQVLDMMAVIANNGSLVRPYLVKKIDAKVVSSAERKELSLNKDALRLVRNGLYKVVNDESGTGKHAKAEGVAVAGKTGTAESPLGRTHAWFSGFAPFQSRAKSRDDGAKICLVVFLEHGGKGSLEPSEIARSLFLEAKARGYL